MLQKLKIKNFRVLKDFEMNRLSRINLVAGRNNSGKTSLLEALFLLAGAGRPDMALNENILRGIVFPGPPPSRTIWQTYWNPIFSDLDTTRSIEIMGNLPSVGRLHLKISPEELGSVEIPLKNPGETLTTRTLEKRALVCSFRRGTKKEFENHRILVADEGIRAEGPTVEIPFPATFLSSRAGDIHKDAIRFGNLRIHKQGELVLDALRVIEPKLRSIEESSVSGAPMIWGDVGLSELVPLSVMGEGMLRIARLVLGISSSPKGLVLVDEIENGLHHSVLPKVWEVVAHAARQFETQVFATTHSFECLEAAHHALSGKEFRFHRLEADEAGSRCITYDPDEIETSIRHEFEVR